LDHAGNDWIVSSDFIEEVIGYQDPCRKPVTETFFPVIRIATIAG